MGKQKIRKTTTKTIAAAIILATLVISCVSPDAVKNQLGTIDAQLGELKTLVDMKADSRVVAEQIDEVNSRVEQALWNQDIQAESIRYGGAGWVVLGACLIIIIFLSAFGLLIYYLLKRKNALLALVTCAISKTAPEVRKAIKAQIKEEALNGGEFSPDHKSELSKFTKKMGTFAKDD